MKRYRFALVTGLTVLLAGAVQPLLPNAQAQQAAPTGGPTVMLGALTIATPWTRQPPKGARVAGGYLKISNAAAQPDTLVAASTTASRRVELHEMAMVDSMMKMRELPAGIPIPAGGSVELKPGGLHLMFMDLVEAPVAGKPMTVRLQFEKAGTVDVVFAVEAAGAAPKKHHH